MSSSKAQLSITKRVLLDFVKFKIDNNFKFFGGNEYIASMLDLTNLDKKALKEENNDLKQDNKYLEQEVETHKHHANMLLSEKTNLVISNTELNIKIQELEDRIRKLENRTTKLENIFYKNGITETQLNEMIEKNENVKSNTTQNSIQQQL